MGCCQSQPAPGVTAAASQRKPDKQAQAAKKEEQHLITTKALTTLETTRNETLRKLRNAQPFILDNSALTALEVADEAGRTLTAENLAFILQGVKAAGVKTYVVAAFSRGRPDHTTLIDNLFNDHAICSGCCAFVDLWGTMLDGVPSQELPAGLDKCKHYGLQNAILDCPIGPNAAADWSKFSVQDYAALVLQRTAWVATNLYMEGRGSPSATWVCLSDFNSTTGDHDAMDRVLLLVKLLSKGIKTDSGELLRPVGLLVEDVDGTTFPFEFAAYVNALRTAMDDAKWDAHILVHMRRNFGLAHASVLECLASGATGVWAGVSDEGSETGHAGYLVTLMNYKRRGNTQVDGYDLAKLRQLAIDTTRMASGALPHPRTEVYGDRALDVVFDSNSAMSSDFVFADAFGLQRRTRISQLATEAMVNDRLTELFGDNGGKKYDTAVIKRMLELLHHDLLHGHKEEYNSPFAAAMLWERAGGVLSPTMQETLKAAKVAEDHALVHELRAYWDQWEASDIEQDPEHKLGRLSFASFYNGFMARYFSCYACDLSREAFTMFDLDQSGFVEWGELLMRAKWAILEYGNDIVTVSDLVKILFEKLVLPEMHRRMIGQSKAAKDSQRLQWTASARRAVDENTGDIRSNTADRQVLYQEWKGDNIIMGVPKAGPDMEQFIKEAEARSYQVDRPNSGTGLPPRN